MGRRRINNAAAFFEGFNTAYRSIGEVLKDNELRKLSGAQVEESPVTRAATGEEVNRAQAETQALATQDAATFGEGANADLATGSGMGSQVKTGNRFKYLGQEYDRAPSKGQQSIARILASADVLEKFGDPGAAVKLRAAGMQAEEAENARTYREELKLAMGDKLPSVKDAVDGGPFNGGNINARAAANQVRQPAPDDLGSYLEKVAPRTIQVMLKNGDVEGAKRFQDFVGSEQGKAYTKGWVTGLRKLSMGDNKGAIQDFERLYNTQLYGDGMTVKLEPNEDGSQYVVTQYGQDGQTLGSRTMKTTDLAKQAALALEPATAIKALAEEESRRATEGAALEKQTLIETHRDQREATKEEARDQRTEAAEDRRDARLSKQLASMERRAQGSGGERVTLTQKANNAEIVAARRRVAGLSAEDIRKKTQQYTDTGRSNEAFDPQLAAAVRKANERMVGEDPEFDQYNAPKKPTPQPAQPTKPATQAAQAAQPAATRQELAKKFRSDHTMHNYKLGNETAHGVEVLDRSGKLVGYYR